MPAGRKSNKPSGRIVVEEIGSVPSKEGVLLFDAQFRPIYCNKEIKTLCQGICKSGSCVLEKPQGTVPELFSIIKRFRKDCRRLEATAGSAELRPHSIVYFSREGSFVIRCTRLEGLGGKARPLWQLVLQEASAAHNFDYEVIDQKYGLTRREKDVLRFVIEGLSTSETAGQLSISKETVKIHLHHIFKKLDVKHRSQIRSTLF